MPDFAARIAEARAAMAALGIDALYLSPGANAFFLTGWKRRPPTYGNIVRNGGWIEGVVLGLRGGPVFLVPRMIKDFWLLPLPDMDVRVLPDLGNPVDLRGDVELGLAGVRRQEAQDIVHRLFDDAAGRAHGLDLLGRLAHAQRRQHL